MHRGHRGRLVGKIKNGDNLYEHELLEALLFNACPRKDVNDIAHSLINEFGGIAGVLNADASRLVVVEGIGQSMAEYLVCLGKCLQRTGTSSGFSVAHSTAQFKKFISARFASAESDRLEFYCLDKDARIRRICSLYEGKGPDMRVSPDDVLKIISIYKPAGAYAAHFCAQGEGSPSDADDAAAAVIKCACSLGGVKLHDYCVAARGRDTFSYRVTDRQVQNLLKAKGARGRVRIDARGGDGEVLE